MSPLVFSGKKVGPIGFGLMSLTTKPTPISDEQRFAAIKAAIDAGCTYLNAGTFYGPPTDNSLTMLAKYFEKYPEDADKIILNVKGANKAGTLDPDGTAANVTKSVADSLETLASRVRITHFEPARKDPAIDYVGETLAAVDKFVQDGKVGGLSLSEVNAATIREAAKTYNISTVEVELSLFHPAPLINGVLEACAELGITVLAYSPLGRGILTGEITSPNDLPEGDFRRHFPWFQPENLAKNLELVDKVKRIAENKGCTPGQIALNWIVALGQQPGMPTIIPIPGSANPQRVKENATVVDLTSAEFSDIEQTLASFRTSGERFSQNLMEFTDL